MNITELQLARAIDQTNLSPIASAADIALLANQAKMHNFCAVAIMPSWIPLASEILEGSQTTVVAAIGFPLGTCTTASKVAETEWAILHGHSKIEIDVVMNISMLKSGKNTLVERELRAVKRAAQGHILKVIIESPLLTPDEVFLASLIGENAGADYIKTSTGFKYLKGWRPSTLDDVRLIRGAVADRVKIKVAGGVSTLSQALAYLEAGASRIGTSAGHLIVEQCRERGGSDRPGTRRSLATGTGEP